MNKRKCKTCNGYGFRIVSEGYGEKLVDCPKCEGKTTEKQYIVMYVKDSDRMAEFDIVTGKEGVEGVVLSYQKYWDEDTEGEELDESKFQVYELGNEVTNKFVKSEF